MASKTRKQRQKQKAKAADGRAHEPVKIDTKKSIHEKKVRPHMRHKHKIRLGHESADIYEGFEDKLGVQWVCPRCNRESKTLGFCLSCSVASQTVPAAQGKKSKSAKEKRKSAKKE